MARATRWQVAYQKSGDPKRADRAAQTLLARGERAELHALLAEVRESEGQPVSGAGVTSGPRRWSRAKRICLRVGAELLLHHADAPASEVFGKGHRLYPKSVRVLVGLAPRLTGRI